MVKRLTIITICLSLAALAIAADKAYYQYPTVKRLRPESRMLLYLAERPGQVISQLELQLDVLRYDVDAVSTAPRTTVSRLRAKLGEYRDVIRCVPCFGYVLEG